MRNEAVVPLDAIVERELRVPGATQIHGVTCDGEAVWAVDGTGERLVRLDPESGRELRALGGFPMEAGTAFDGTHLWQVANGRLLAVDPATGRVVRELPAPNGDDASGLSYAEGALWVGGYRGRTIQKVDPATGAVLRTLQSDRFVTGVSFVDGELWHGTGEPDRVGEDRSELRRIDPETGAPIERLRLPEGVGASGLEADRDGRLWFGKWEGGRGTGTVAAVRKPSRR
jgi:streptogramin lyase